MRTASGCILTFVWFALIAMALFGTMMGECFEGFGHTCPTDHERNMRLLAVFVGGLTIYLAVGFAVVRFANRRDDE